MHGPTQTTVESGGPGKNFGQRTVKQEITSQLLHAAGAFLFHRLKTITTQERFHYRHKWEPGMLVMWDNRCLNHKATGGYEGYRRELHRTTIAA